MKAGAEVFTFRPWSERRYGVQPRMVRRVSVGMGWPDVL